MDSIIWSHILYELALSVSGEQKLDVLEEKAARSLLKKLDCSQVSILRYINNRLETTCIVPRVALKNPMYSEIIDEIEKMLVNSDGKDIISLKRDLNYYGFPLHNFGLLILGKDDPLKEEHLKDLSPITNMLAQNCFFNLDMARKRRAIKAELKKERHLLKVIIDSVPDLIVYKDMNGVHKVANKAAENFLFLFSEIEEDKLRTTDNKVLESDCERRFEQCIKQCNGSPVYFEVIEVPVYDEKNIRIGTVDIARDITKRKHHERRLQYMGAHDQLTGLYNRRFLEKEISRLDTPTYLPISVIMGDLNGLKLANDVFGHREGDNLLIKASEVIKKSCRREDLVARWGGDEFVIFLPQTDAETAEKISQRIKEKCRLHTNGYIQLSIALGLATKNDTSEDIWQVLRKASDKMYTDKLLHAQTYKRAVISSLQTVLSEKSTETKEHAERLRIMCKQMGEKMGLDLQQLERLEMLAILHNIGKVAISKDILLKQGPLSDEEWDEIKKHPEIGYRFARSVPDLAPISECILFHHERWDGTGYPRGIQKESIPLLARILAVVDAFDAMTSNRVYRKAMTPEKAIDTIMKGSGTQFDPKVVDVFLQLILEGK